MTEKYEKLRAELRSIYYADYIIDILYKRVKAKCLAYSVENKWLEEIIEAIDKMCRFQLYYINNHKLLYDSKYKDMVIKHIIKGRKIPNNARYSISQFYKEWERNKVAI